MEWSISTDILLIQQTMHIGEQVNNNILCDIDYVFTICTDFNLPNFNWNNMFDVSSLCPLNASLAKFIVDNGVTQLISE